jgi:hypothetical protein
MFFRRRGDVSSSSESEGEGNLQQSKSSSIQPTVVADGNVDFEEPPPQVHPHYECHLPDCPLDHSTKNENEISSRVLSCWHPFHLDQIPPCHEFCPNKSISHSCNYGDLVEYSLSISYGISLRGLITPALLFTKDLEKATLRSAIIISMMKHFISEPYEISKRMRRRNHLEADLEAKSGDPAIAIVLPYETLQPLVVFFTPFIADGSPTERVYEVLRHALSHAGFYFIPGTLDVRIRACQYAHGPEGQAIVPIPLLLSHLDDFADGLRVLLWNQIGEFLLHSKSRHAQEV